jgi:hypothetical protein
VEVGENMDLKKMFEEGRGKEGNKVDPRRQLLLHGLEL